MRKPQQGLATYVVYDHPEAHPGHYVLCRQDVRGGKVVQAPAKDVVLFTSLEGARSWCRGLGLVPLGRMAEDDPSIAEVWT